MDKLISLVLLCLFSSSCFANLFSVTSPTRWFLKLDAGYAWSQDAGISNPDPAFWDAANQGYDASLGNRPFASIGFGSTLNDYFNLDLDYTHYSTFNYQKYQTGSSATPGFTGNARTRFFDLDAQSLLLNLTLHPKPNQFSFLVQEFTIYPFVSIGAGLGFNRVSNFYTVGFNPTATSGVVTSIGNEANKTSFAWQGSVGVTVAPCKSYLAADFGYRYYDGGNFETPNQIMGNAPGDAGSLIPAPRWQGKLKTNQIFMVIRFFAT